MKQSDGRVITWAYGCQISSDKIREIFVHQFIHANSPRSATVYSTYMIKHRGPKNPVVHVTITQREGGISIRCPTCILVNFEAQNALKLTYEHEAGDRG